MGYDRCMGSGSRKDKQSTFYKQVNGFRENPTLAHTRRERKNRSNRGYLSLNVAFYYSFQSTAPETARAIQLPLQPELTVTRKYVGTKARRRLRRKEL